MAEVDKGGLVVECISARVTKIRVKLVGTTHGVSFVIFYAPTKGGLTREKDRF